MKHRVSNVEAFRQWEADSEAELEPLLSKLRGTSAPSDLMAAGTAFHRALEMSETGIEAEELTADGYTFFIVSPLVIELCPIRELRASKTYMVDDLPIVVSGQVDQIEGLRIEDHKTTGRFDPERYLTGYQWRVYLDIFAAEVFRWNVFEIGAADEPLTYDVYAQHQLEQYRYPSMTDDCQALVERYARFVREQGLA